MTILDAKRSFVIDSAIELFLKRPISSVTVKDIAKESGVGEATVYRYFSAKRDLVIACALKLQKKTEQIFSSSNKDGRGGFSGLSKFYYSFLDIFEKEPSLYYFLNEFDSYCLTERIDGLSEYADNLDKFKAAYIVAYNEGLKDGSVRAVKDIELFYYSTTHAILSLCKKLALSEGVLEQDKKINKYDEIKTLIDTVLYSLNTAV